MNEDLYQCTARGLATKNPETVDSDTTVGEAYEWFQRKGYDYAPVIDADNPVGYIGKTIVTDEVDSKKVGRVMKDIKLQNIISSDAQFYEILTGLREEFFYLLGGGRTR